MKLDQRIFVRFFFVHCSILSQQLICIECIGTDSSCWPSKGDFKTLENSIDGGLYFPSSNPLSGWHKATKLKNSRIKSSPAVAVMAESESDVVAVVSFAFKRNLLLSIKSTGHCYSGNCMAPNSLHIDLSRLNKVEVLPDQDVMRVGPGANFGKMYKAANEASKLIVGGMGTTVGPVGWSLGGGHGPLVRSFGLGADNIVSVNIVLANGTLIRSANLETHPDLLWGLRGGGGGSFGVITQIEFRIHPAPKSVTGMSCYWPMEKSNSSRPGQHVLEEWVGNIQHTLEDRWSFYTIGMKQPIPYIMKVKHWNPLIMDGLVILEGLYVGEWGESMLDSVSGLLSLEVDHELNGGCKLTNYSTFSNWHNAQWFTNEHQMRSYMSSSFLQANASSDDYSSLAQIIVDSIVSSPDSDLARMFFGIQLGGAAALGTQTSISAAFRGATLLQEVTSGWLSPTKDNVESSWVHGVGLVINDLNSFQGSYLNEADPTLSNGTYEKRFWGSNFGRLKTVKLEYDPSNFFQCWQCLEPLN